MQIASFRGSGESTAVSLKVMVVLRVRARVETGLCATGTEKARNASTFMVFYGTLTGPASDATRAKRASN